MHLPRFHLLGLALWLALGLTQSATAQTLRTPESEVVLLPAVDAGSSLEPAWTTPDGRIIAPPPVGTFIDLDTVQEPGAPSVWTGDNSWEWQILPTSLIYKSYLAGVKESRMSTSHIYSKTDGWLWDATLGGRVGLL